MLGEADTLALTLGYLASATVCPIAYSTLLSLSMDAVTPMWSRIKVSCGCCSAIGPSSAVLPGAKHMTGKPAFSAAAGNPFPVRRLRLPQVHLRVDDHAPVDLCESPARPVCRERGGSGTRDETASRRHGSILPFGFAETASCRPRAIHSRGLPRAR